MLDRKKVCYTLDQKVIDLISEKSVLEKKLKSEYLADCIEYGYKIMMGKYKENGKKPYTHVEKRRFYTIGKTYILPLDVIKRLSWFSEKLGVKKSHLVVSCVLNYEKRKGTPDSLDDLDNLMDYVIDYYERS